MIDVIKLHRRNSGREYFDIKFVQLSLEIMKF